MVSFSFSEEECISLVLLLSAVLSAVVVEVVVGDDTESTKSVGCSSKMSALGFNAFFFKNMEAKGLGSENEKILVK